MYVSCIGRRLSHRRYWREKKKLGLLLLIDMSIEILRICWRRTVLCSVDGNG